MPAAPTRILIAHHLLLGDTIMLTPLLAKCRARWPDAEIVLTCPLPSPRSTRSGPTVCGRSPTTRACPRRCHRCSRNGVRPRAPARRQPALLARPRAGRAWIVAFAGDSPALQRLAGRRVAARIPRHALRLGRPRRRAGRRSAACAATASPTGRAGAEPVALPAARVLRAACRRQHAAEAVAAERWRGLAERLEAKGFAVVLSAGPGEAALLDAIDPEARLAASRRDAFAGCSSRHLLAGAVAARLPRHRRRPSRPAHRHADGRPVRPGFGAALRRRAISGATSPFTALTIPDFPCRDQSLTMKREVAWIRRCERFPGTGPGQCPQARCMLALTDVMVWEAAAKYVEAARA